MSIRYKCEECGSVLKIREDRVGKEGHCPKCKTAFVVPADDADPSEESVADGPETKEKPAAPAVADDANFDPVAFLMTEDDEASEPKKSRRGASAAVAGDAPDMRVKSAGTAEYAESDEPDVRVGGPAASSPAAADRAELEAQLRTRKPKRAAEPPSASESADDMLRVNAAASSAKDLMTKTVEESRIRAAQMPKAPEKPGVDYKATAGELLFRFAPAVVGFVLLIVLATMFGNLMVGPDVTVPDLGQVTGTVTKGGEPLFDARVDFHPIDAEDAGSASGYTDENGFYELRYTKGFNGTALGKNRVEVSLVGPDGRPVVPPQTPYGLGSNEIFEVKEGSQTYDIKIPEGP